MESRLLLTTFVTIFLAELGDKTQIATLLLAADAKGSRWTVFLGAALALVACAALGVLGGAWVRGWVSPRTLSGLGGAAFVGMGAWMIVRAVRG
jgi:putative Ca2+/H+ antiporter (TMEM165/GDT1 family)